MSSRAEAEAIADLVVSYLRLTEGGRRMHKHRWGTRIYDVKRRRHYRLCIDGYCPAGRTEDTHRTFPARPERRAPEGARP